MGLGSSKVSAKAIQSLDEAGDFLPTRFKASRKLKIRPAGNTSVVVTISDSASGKELLKVSRDGNGKVTCSVEGKEACKFTRNRVASSATGKLVCGDTVLYTAKQPIALDGSFAKLITFERGAGEDAHNMVKQFLPGDVTCAKYVSKGRTEYVVYNQRFASAGEAAEAISRSTIIARAAIKQHVYDKAKFQFKYSATGDVLSGGPSVDPENPFQLEGVAIETELHLPRDVESADGRYASSLAALLFFAALPLLDTSKDEFYHGPASGAAF